MDILGARFASEKKSKGAQCLWTHGFLTDGERVL